MGKADAFRDDAAFAILEMYEAPEGLGSRQTRVCSQGPATKIAIRFKPGPSSVPYHSLS
jgi:hypothetical protein